jgi:hypothetical protein
MNTKMIVITLCTLVLIGAASAIAGMSDETQDRRSTMGPPPQAYEACKDNNEGDSVKITTPRGETINAICKQFDGKLAAMPEGGVRDPRNASEK